MHNLTLKIGLGQGENTGIGLHFNFKCFQFCETPYLYIGFKLRKCNPAAGKTYRV